MVRGGRERLGAAGWCQSGVGLQFCESVVEVVYIGHLYVVSLNEETDFKDLRILVIFYLLQIP